LVYSLHMFIPPISGKHGDMYDEVYPPGSQTWQWTIHHLESFIVDFPIEISIEGGLPSNIHNFCWLNPL